MYQSPFNKNYIIPDLLKYECLNCDKQFILSDGYENSRVVCPYCKNNQVEATVSLDDPDLLDELGCMAIGFDLVSKDN